MATLPFTDRGLRIALSGTYGTAKWANILHAQYAGTTPTSADLATLAAQIGQAWNVNIMARVVSTCILTQSLVVDIGSETGAAGVDPTSRPGVMGGTGTYAATARVISWKIARRYRGGHPRSYVCGIITTDVADQNHWSTAANTTANGLASTFRTSFNALTSASTGLLTLGSWSYYHGKNTDGTPALRPVPRFDAFIGNAIDSRMDSQRRRNGKPTP